MTPYLLGIIFILACIGLFYILDKGSRQIVRAILNGKRFNKLYLRYLRATTKHEFDAASSVSNSDRAWSSVVFEKVYEIGIPGVPYTKRDSNLEYIKAEVLTRPQFGRKLADELIKVLPKQYGNLNFQAKLACYICDLLNRKISDSSGNNAQSILKPVHSEAIDYLTTATSAWISGIAYLVLSLYILDDLHPLWVAVSSFLLFVLMVIPLFNLIGTRLAKFTTVVTIATIIILYLGVFAIIAHGKINSRLEIDLSHYENPNVELAIRYPEWLTVNNTECSGKKISMFLQGKIITPIRFHVNSDDFYLLDEDCGEIIPQLDVSQPEIQAFEFYIAARDQSPFYLGRTELRVIPSYVSPSGEIEFQSNNTLNIRLEHWMWGLASNLYVTLGSAGGTLLLFLVNYFVSKRSA